jgi:hypothetical protein
MKKQTLWLAVVMVGLVVHFAAVVADAQLVQVRPGYVRAPFVRVERNPDGSAHVRAPFVRVNTPYRYQGGSRAPLDAAPSPPQWLSEMDWATLRSALLDAAARLDSDLNRMAGSQRWRARLHPGLIRDLVAPDVNGPPTPEIRNQLIAIYNTFDETARSPRNSVITGMTSFRDVHAALAELLTPPRERLYWQLVSNWQHLEQALMRVNHAPHWQGHLALPESFLVGADGRGQAALIEPDNEQLSDLVEVFDRFEQVRGDGRYHMISSLDAFQRTQRRLAEYLEMYDVTTSEVTPPAPGLEPIPAPEPLR